MVGLYRLTYGAALLAALGLSACSGDDAPQTFAAPDYSYLPQIHLGVATISVTDKAQPAPDSLNARAPFAPDQTLKLMESQRLVATGSSGTGAFTINQATINRTGEHALSGRMDVTLTVRDTTGQHVGMAHAQVSRQLDGGDRDPESRAVLYDMTNQMMQDMNVELAYQIQKTLASWLTDATGTPLTGGVQTQALGSPGSPTGAETATVPTAQTSLSDPSLTTQPPASPTVPPIPKPAAPAAPDAIFPTGDDVSAPLPSVAPASPAPAVHSPKAGVLSLPGTVNPAAAPG